MMQVAISRIHFPITALGPGRRVGLWFQGCSIRCAGCISRDTWDSDRGLVPLADVLRALSKHAEAADGLTVSGGEPFDQPEALFAVLAHWRAINDKSTLVFSGYSMAKLTAWLEAYPGLIDALMSDPFRSDRPQTLAMRGSDNQTLHVLTKRGHPMLAYERPIDDRDRHLDIQFDESGYAWMAGIPARGDLARLRRALAKAGHQIVTSEAAGAILE